MSTSERREPSIPLPGAAAAPERERRPAGGAGSTTGGAVRERTTDSSVSKGDTTWLKVVAGLLAGILLGATAMAFLDREDPGFGGGVDEDRYQAVILSNDKVYFGRLKSVSGDFFQLRDAFFLRETRTSEDAEPVRALLPVNREIHAPENRMLIRKDEVVLVENLATNSPILTEIRRQTGRK